MTFRLIEADCVEAMAAMDEASVDAIVTDPPYGLEFMGKEWDRFKTGRGEKYAAGGAMVEDVAIPGTGFSTLPSFVSRPAKRCRTCGKQSWSGSPCVCKTPDWVLDNSPLLAFQAWCETWAVQALRVLKPGGHLLAFGGTRTFHRLTCALEDAGFEIRDCLSWLYGSGFPKSLDVSKAIDKTAGAEREVVGTSAQHGGGVVGAGSSYELPPDVPSITAPATPDAQRWQGWGTALKPAWEPVVLARKPLAGTVAANVLAHGTGAINVDGTRISFRDDADNKRTVQDATWYAAPNQVYGEYEAQHSRKVMAGADSTPDSGRWPPNVVLDEEAAALLDEQSGELHSQDPATRAAATQHAWMPGTEAKPRAMYGDTGGASRFFYTAKAGREERNRGLEHRRVVPTHRYGAGIVEGVDPEAPALDRNHHPTVKPVSLMQWLCRMVTPPGGTVLDPFSGSGSTGIAALREGFEFIGIEREHDYVEIARDRILGDAPLFNQEVTPTDRPA